MRRPAYNLPLALIAVLSLTIAGALAYFYEPGARFVFSTETYKVLLPFFLTTVTVGLIGLIYTQYQSAMDAYREDQLKAAEAARQREAQAAEARRAALDKTAAAIDARIDALRAFYSDVLELFQTAKRARRRIRVLCRGGRTDGRFEIRFADLMDIVEPLTTAELQAERIVKRLDVEPEIVDGEAPDTTRSRRLRGQIDALRLVLREVLRSAEWAGLSATLADKAQWVPLPEAFVIYAQRADVGGDFGFNRVAANFDDFTAEVLQIIAGLEAARPAVSRAASLAER